MNITKKVLSFALPFVILASSASAVSVSKMETNDNETLLIEGTAEGLEYGDAVSVSVFRPNAAYDTIDFENIDFSSQNLSDYLNFSKEGLIAHKTVMTGDGGVFTASAGLSKSTEGEHIVAVTDSKSGLVAVKKFYFAPYSVKVKFIEEAAEIVLKKTSEDLCLKLGFGTDPEAKNENSPVGKMFAISADSMIFGVSEAGLSGVFYRQLKDMSADRDIAALKPREFIETLEFSALLRAVSEGKADVWENREKLSLDASFVETFEDTVSEDGKKTLMTYFSGKDFFSLNDVHKAFADSVILSVLKNPMGWNDYKTVIDRHGEYIGIDMEKYGELENKEDVTDYLDASYSDISKFKADVDSAVETLLDKTGNGSGDSGSGGGSGSGGLGGGSVTASGGGTLSGSAPSAGENSVQHEKIEFSDIEDVPWAEVFIVALAEKGIVSGVGDGKFEPMKSVTREELVKMVVLSTGLEPVETGTHFEDASESWAKPYIACAEANGLVNGVSETVFGIGENITRQDAAVILYRAAKLLKITFEAGGESFKDGGLIADYAAEAVYALRKKGIINGKSDNNFAPEDFLTRAEAAKIVCGILNLTEM